MTDLPTSAAPPLPTSIWVVAWASLAGQGVQLLRQGVRVENEGSVLVSVLLGGLVVGFVSAGVVRARTVRLALAWIVLALALVAETISLVTVDDAGQAGVVLLSLGTTVVALAALARFRRSDWYAWQRGRPPVHEGAPIGQLVAIGVLVGALGGVTGVADRDLGETVRVEDPAQSSASP